MVGEGGDMRWAGDSEDGETRSEEAKSKCMMVIGCCWYAGPVLEDGS
jgi:hypothetical protein